MYQQEKTDALVQARVKSTTLATVARFFALKGQQLPSRSFLMRLVLEEFEKILIKGGHIERVSSITDARNILTKLGLGELNPGGRGGRNYMEEMQREVYEFEGWDTAELATPRTKASMLSEAEEMEKLAKDPARLLQSMEEHLVPRVDKQRERSKSEHDAFGDVGNVSVVEESHDHD